ncbi:MAG: twin-arginine translocase subunit TatC, partial [Candidatus Caenarcaniphilales bacterium]|nr:twin-arginine translocase subunit TatC [Candidatus Caenarcaniphilales bacterium]
EAILPGLISLENHIEEIRSRILFVLCFLILAFGAAFYITPILIKLLESLAPKGTLFFQLKPGELFFVYLRVSAFLAIIFSLPFLTFQVQRFVWPGLKPQEKQIASMILLIGPLLFFAGSAFAYFVALRPMLNFLLGFGVDLALVQPQYSLDYYISLVVSILCIFGLSFQIPVVLFILAVAGFITSFVLLRFWREALFGSFVLAAFLTPTPDPINMGILGLALSGLYFISVGSMKLIGR